MKLYRGSGYKRQLTDDQKPAVYVTHWEPGRVIHFNGTKDKSGKNWTHLDLVIEEQDVIALVIAFLKADPTRLLNLVVHELELLFRERDQENERLRKELQKLRRETGDKNLKIEIGRILWPRLHQK